MRIFFGGTLLAFLFVLQCVEVEAQPRSGMVTEPLDSAWVDGQRMFLTWRKGDPFAADVPRDQNWRYENRNKYRYAQSSSTFDANIKCCILESFSVQEVQGLFCLEPRFANMLGMIFTVDDEGFIQSVVFAYPDIMEFTVISGHSWRKLERNIRKRIIFRFSSPFDRNSPLFSRTIRFINITGLYE